MKNALSMSILPMLCNTIILPYYKYLNMVWACNYSSNLHKLLVLQKIAMLYVLLVQMSIGLMQLIYLKDIDD